MKIKSSGQVWEKLQACGSFSLAEVKTSRAELGLVALTAGGDRKRLVEGYKEDKREERSSGHFEEMERE